MTNTSTAIERVEAADIQERKRIGRCLAAADVMASSSLLRQDLRKDGNARAVAITLDQLGVPVTINNMNACYVVNGAVAMMTWLWCSVAAAIGGHEVWLDEASNAERGIAHLKRADSGTVRTVVFSIEDAQRAGLTTGPNKHNYDKYTTDMLGWRALSRVVKRYAPEVMAGLASAGAAPAPLTRAPDQRGEYLGAEDPDDDIAEGELVDPATGEVIEQGEDVRVSPTAVADADDWAAFTRWKQAGKPRDDSGKPVDVPPNKDRTELVQDDAGPEIAVAPPGPAVAGAEQAAAAAGDRDNVAGEPVVGPAAVPGPVDWREVAYTHGVTAGGLLRKAREFAAKRGLPQPASLDEELDPLVAGDVMGWLA